MEKQVELGARVWAENKMVGVVEKIVVDPATPRAGLSGGQTRAHTAPAAPHCGARQSGI